MSDHDMNDHNMSDHDSSRWGLDEQAVEKQGALLIDCATCEMRNIACADCVVTAILGLSGGMGCAHELAFDDSEARALAVLANGGLVPHLRLVDARQRPA